MAYSNLLEGGINGSEIRLLKEYFYCVQLMKNSVPGATVLKDLIDVCEISYIMRAMGYYPSELEVSQFMYAHILLCS